MKRPRFTWWGGMLGAHVLSHTVCGLCRFGFNAKTGKSNHAFICAYLAAMTIVGVAMMWPS